MFTDGMNDDFIFLWEPSQVTIKMSTKIGQLHIPCTVRVILADISGLLVPDL